MTRIKWTIDKVQTEALKYRTRTAFARQSSRAYQAAVRHGWYDIVCGHMVRQGDRKHRYVYQVISDAHKRVYVGLSMNVETRIRQHVHSRYQNIRELLAEEHRIVVSSLLTAEQAIAEETRLIEMYRRAGWTTLNRAVRGVLGGFDARYTKPLVIRDAMRFQTRKEFERHARSAYQAAYRNGWLAEACAHMPRRRKDWTKEELKAEASKYRTRGEFADGSPNAYAVCRTRRLMAEVCGHMCVAKRGRISAA